MIATNGNKLTQTDGKGNTTTYEYNAANKLKRKTDPGGRTGTTGNYTYNAAKTESYTYNANGSLAAKTDRNGKNTNYSYDIFGRLIGENAAGEQKSYTYDNNGNQLTMTDSTGTTTRTYDEENRVTSKTVPGIGISQYEYDIAITDNITGSGIVSEKTTDPKGNITEKTYDKVGRLATVTTDGKTTQYTYYPNGNRKSVIYPDGTSENYEYSKNNQVSLLQNKKADGSMLQSYSYTYDAAGNQTSKTEEKGTTDYKYDRLNRLSEVKEPTGKTTTYTFDKAGNRKIESVTGVNTSGTSITITTTYTYNEQNRLTQTETASTGKLEKTIYVYDNNGNLKSKNKSTLTRKDAAATTTTAAITPQFGVEIKRSTDKGTGSKDVALYSYDNYNRLTKLIEGTTTSTYAYNAEDYRVEKTVNNKLEKYLYEADKVVLETDGAGIETARNVYGTNLLYREVAASQTVSVAEEYYYLYNAHGDVTALLDTNGKVSATYDYDAFGNIISQTGNANNNITYAGYQYDKETDLYYLNARYYDSKIARFLSEDTYRGQVHDPLSLNLYTYCHNEPIMYWDPTGHYEETDKLIKDQATLGLLEIYGKNWDTYNKKANEYKNKDKELYDFYISLRNEQHDKAEAARADYIADSGKYAYDYAKEKLGEKKADYIVAVEDYYKDDRAMVKKQVYQVMNTKPTQKVTSNEKILAAAQGSARQGLDIILFEPIDDYWLLNNYSPSFYRFSYGKKYSDKYNYANGSNYVWQGFAFVGGLYLDINNPAGTPTAIADKRSRIIVDYTSESVSSLLADNGEPGGMDFINILDPFQHEKKAKEAEIKSNYVNSTEYKYLIDGTEGNSITEEFIERVEALITTVEESSYPNVPSTQNSVYKKLILEYLNTVIEINKNHDETVKKLNKEFKMMFK